MTDAPGTAVLLIAGDVDARSAEGYYEAASSLLRPGVDVLIIDFAGAEFIDSTGLAMLVRIADLAVIDGVKVRLRTVCPRVMRTLDLAGMGTFLPIENPPAVRAASEGLTG